VDKTPVDKTPASTFRVKQPVTSVDVIGAALVCPVGAREHVAGKVSLYGLGQLVQHLGM
jgi:hypothetical protein